MLDIRHVSSGGGSLSKGTQSDGLISDTSIEELTSSSSAENHKEGKICEKFVAKNSKEACNEARNSTDFVQSKSLQTSLHQIQTPCQLYIKWGVLISFGVLLWVALWVMDVLTPNPFSKEDLGTAKKVTLKAEVVKEATPPAWWFYHLWNYAWNLIISVTTLEILMVLSCITIFIYFETHGRNQLEEINTRLCCEMEQSETDSNSFHLDDLEDSTSKESESKSCSGSSSKFSPSVPRNFMTQDKLKVKSNLGAKSAKCLKQKEKVSSTEHCTSNPSKSCCYVNNVRKRLVHFNDVKNSCESTQRISCIDGSSKVAGSEVIFDKPNFNVSCISCMSKGDDKKANDGTFSCAILNESTSFKSEKIETWFKLPNSDSAEKVMHSFDSELEELFTTRNSLLLTSFGKRMQHLQRFRDDNSISCEYGDQPNTVIFNLDYNGGIISSSPAFQKFLLNLTKNEVSEPYVCEHMNLIS